MSEPLESPEKNMPAVKPRRLRRSVLVLPSLFTVANIFCGYYAILLTINQMYWQASIAIAIAILLDSMDGFIARLTNTSSDFGEQLDSLSDVISFGVAPSILVLNWGFLPNIDPRLAIATAFTFTVCGAMRLARFNVQSGNRKHFVGLPIPAAGGTIAAIVYFFEAPVAGAAVPEIQWIAAIVHFFRDPVVDQVFACFMVAITFILAFLMVSTLRYSSLKGVAIGKKSHLAVLVIALLFVLIFFLSRPTLLILAVSYAISGPVMKVHGILRRKTPDEVKGNVG
jgi:CDP-diacylglycerol--serine O-phosphatidyltransferase